MCRPAAVATDLGLGDTIATLRLAMSLLYSVLLCALPESPAALALEAAGVLEVGLYACCLIHYPVIW